ncbi:hypothetical protein ACSJJR_06105, partial [Actinomyces sp. W5033]
MATALALVTALLFVVQGLPAPAVASVRATSEVASPALAPGYGTFSLTMRVVGEGLPLVPEDAAFTIWVDYVLPGPADQFPGWTAPGTLYSNGKSGTFTLTVVRDVPTPGKPLPAGTTVTLSEDVETSTVSPTVVTWGEPEFWAEPNHVETSTFTVEDGKVTQSEVINNAVPVGQKPQEPAPVVTTTPPPTSVDQNPQEPTSVVTTAPTAVPSPTPSRPGRPLARTGASNVLVLGVLGSVLVA